MVMVKAHFFINIGRYHVFNITVVFVHIMKVIRVVVKFSGDVS